MKNSITKLFVYGSLRKGFHHSAYEYISKYFTALGEAKVRGRLCDLGEYPAATPTAEDFFIIGELYELKRSDEFDWAFQQLDDYEGLNPEEGEVALYRRELAQVFYNNELVQAWIYWYNGEVTGKPVIASGNIFDYPMYKNNQ